jgi:predicted 3-demethylubiquinone-9 3-methyltransferase (glyoxalase superfamily)
MEAIFKKTKGDYLEATLEINGQEIIAMDEFGGSNLSLGDIINIELAAGLAYEDEEQNSMLDSNLDGEKKLEHQRGWSYRAYGVVTSIEKETLVDVGLCELVAPFETSITGESIAFTITRLDAYAANK